MTPVLVLVVLLVAVSFFLSFRSAVSRKKNSLLGVGIPPEAWNDVRIQELIRGYKRGNLLLFLAALAGGFLLILPEAVSMVFLFMTVWIGLVFLGGNLLFRNYSQRLADLRDREGWKAPAAGTGRGHFAPRGDDPRRWRGGVYNNPEDPRLFVRKRIGYGLTINIGHKKGKVLFYGGMALMAVMLLSMFFLFLALDRADYALEIRGGQVAVKAPLYGFSFPAEDIERVSLVERLPQRSRTNGAETPTYALGNYSLAGYGRGKLYVYKNKPPYIVIKLPGLHVFFNAKSQEETERYFQALQELAP